jgi:hypothetical protein
VRYVVWPLDLEFQSHKPFDNSMNTENPYHASSHLPELAEVRFNPSNRTLWKAYFLAPAVAPISFVAIVLLIGLLAPRLGVEINEAGIIVLPVIALTIGVVSSYFVAGVIGMPIAFYLRRVNLLNSCSVHGAAFCWAVLFSSLCAIVMVGGRWSELPLALCYFGLGVIPPVVLSGTAFWLLLRRFSRTESGATHGATTAANHG